MLGRKTVSSKMLSSYPAFVRLDDILFDGDEDLLDGTSGFKLRGGMGLLAGDAGEADEDDDADGEQENAVRQIVHVDGGQSQEANGRGGR